jgi:Uma2 family endonuclease
MTPIGSQHAGIVNVLNRLFTQELSAKAVVSVQNPIRLDQYSEPEPDLAVLAWRDDHYQSRQPEPRDVKLIVEVSDTSVERDRRDKVSLYASFGIPCVWLVDVESKAVESFYSPDGDSYRDVATKRQAEMIPGPSIDDFELSPSDIFLE